MNLNCVWQLTDHDSKIEFQANDEICELTKKISFPIPETSFNERSKILKIKTAKQFFEFLVYHLANVILCFVENLNDAKIILKEI